MLDNLSEDMTIERAVAVRIATFSILTATLQATASLISFGLDEKLYRYIVLPIPLGMISHPIFPATGPFSLESEVANQWGNLNQCVNQGQYETFKSQALTTLPPLFTPMAGERKHRRGFDAPTCGETYAVYVPLDDETMPRYTAVEIIKTATFLDLPNNLWNRTSTSGFLKWTYTRRGSKAAKKHLVIPFLRKE